MIRLLGVLLCFFAVPVLAQTSLRLATYNVGLGRDGPGLLLKDILDRDKDILAIAHIIGEVEPDILLITGFDNDYQNVAIGQFSDLLGAETEVDVPYIFAPLGNAGMDSGLDLNHNGHVRDWADSWGFGRFEGSEGMALLSRFPITQNSHRFDHIKWQDLGPQPQNPDGSAFFPVGLWPHLRLASHSFWDVEITLPSGPFHILAAHPTPPVFDGEEDANGLRNEAEITFLIQYLSGEAFQDDDGNTASLSSDPFALLADLNADPFDGDSRKPALRALLAHPRLQDPGPTSEGGLASANATHSGPAAQDTADWDEASSGNLRVDYVLPSAALTVLGAGTYWPVESALVERAETRHRLVWVDVALP